MSTLRHLVKYVRGESLNLNGRGLNLLGNLVFGLGLISGSLGQTQSLNFGCFNAFLANFEQICSLLSCRVSQPSTQKKLLSRLGSTYLFFRDDTKNIYINCFLSVHASLICARANGPCIGCGMVKI